LIPKIEKASQPLIENQIATVSGQAVSNNTVPIASLAGVSSGSIFAKGRASHHHLFSRSRSRGDA